MIHYTNEKKDYKTLVTAAIFGLLQIHLYPTSTR